MLLGSMLCDMGDQLIALCTLGPIDYFSTQADIIRTKGDIYEKKDHHRKKMVHESVDDVIESVEIKTEESASTDQNVTEGQITHKTTEKANRKLLFEEVEAWENYDKEYSDKYKFNLRAYYGHKIVKETIRTLTKKSSVPTNYGPEFKQCSNAVSIKLGFCKIFPDVEDIEYEFFDFSDNIKYPIILNSDIDSLKYLEKTSEGIRINMSLLNRKNLMPGEQSFDDSSVEVIDMAEQVKAAEAAGKVITVEEKDIKMVSEEPVEEKKEENKKIRTLLNNDNLILNPESQVPTDHQKETFKKCFGEYLEGKIYDLNRLQSGEIECIVRDDEHGLFNRFWIDPGLVVGNGYNVLGRVSGNDTIPVHYTEKEICQKVFNDPVYTLTPEEVHKCMSHMFMNQSIYHYIDMSNMYDRISKLSESQFKKLGKKLTYILNSLTPEEKGRIRISAWKGTDNFKMISDNKCRSPFPGQTCTRFTGVAISVKGDSVKITFNGNSRQSTITNYNVL